MSDLRQAAIAGVYMTEQGGLQDRTSGSLYVEAVNGALEDAGLTAREIDGIIGAGPEGAGIVGDFVDSFGAPLRFHAQTGVGASSSSAGMGIAAMAIAHGYANVVIVPTASGGAVHPNAPRRGGGPSGSPFEYIWGTTRASDYALAARRHMHDYGTTSEQLAEVAVAARKHATLNPGSVMGGRGEISVEDVINSRVIADPLHLYDPLLAQDPGGYAGLGRRLHLLRPHVGSQSDLLRRRHVSEHGLRAGGCAPRGHTGRGCLRPLLHRRHNRA